MQERECVRKKSGEASGLGKLVYNFHHFPKINKGFSVKGKRFYVDYYFTSHKTPINAKNIFCKSFYSETNGASVL